MSRLWMRRASRREPQSDHFTFPHVLAETSSGEVGIKARAETTVAKKAVGAKVKNFIVVERRENVVLDQR